MRGERIENIPNTWEPYRVKWPLPKLSYGYVCYIYFIQSLAEPHLIKIGRSGDVEKRLVALRNGSPVKLKVVGLLAAPMWMEAALHELFKDERQHGEWFLPSARLVRFIERHKKGEAASLEYMAEGFLESGADYGMLEKLGFGYKNLQNIWVYGDQEE